MLLVVETRASCQEASYLSKTLSPFSFSGMDSVGTTAGSSAGSPELGAFLPHLRAGNTMWITRAGLLHEHVGLSPDP